jgi:hypothetical protein
MNCNYRMNHNLFCLLQRSSSNLTRNALLKKRTGGEGWMYYLSYSEESNVADSKSKRDLYDCIIKNKAQPQY